MTRYAKNIFRYVYLSNAGMNEEIKTLKIENKNIYQLKLCDTAGQERYRSIPRKYYRNADGILLLYDVEDKESFEHIEEWMQDIKEYLGKNDVKEGIEKNENNLVIYLLGNKIDLINNGKEKVTKEEVEKLAN